MDLDKNATAVLDKNGEPTETPATFLTADEAQLLRDYQAFGERNGLQGAMTCGECGKAIEVYVQSEIGFFCECRVLLWRPS